MFVLKGQHSSETTPSPFLEISWGRCWWKMAGPPCTSNIGNVCKMFLVSSSGSGSVMSQFYFSLLLFGGHIFKSSNFHKDRNRVCLSACPAPNPLPGPKQAVSNEWTLIFSLFYFDLQVLDLSLFTVAALTWMKPKTPAFCGSFPCSSVSHRWLPALGFASREEGGAEDC